MNVILHQDGTVSVVSYDMRGSQNRRKTLIVDSIIDELNPSQKRRIERHLRRHQWYWHSGQYGGHWTHPKYERYLK